MRSCLITVTFTPTDTGPKRGTLRTGPGGPTVALTGNGVKHRTPPVLPLTLDESVRGFQPVGGRGVVNINYAQMEIGHCHARGCPVYDAKLVLGGDVIKTTKRFKVGAEIDPPSPPSPDRGQGQAPEAAQEGADEPQDHDQVHGDR